MSETDTTLGLDFEEELELTIKEQIAKIQTGTFGTVLRYDRSTQMATVQPVIRCRFIGRPGYLRMPPICCVSVKFPSSGGYSITWDLVKGDVVWLEFADRAIEDWQHSGNADVSPRSWRRHHYTDATCVPTGRSFNKPLKSVEEGAMLLGEDRYEGGGSENELTKPALKRLRVDAERIELAWDHETKPKRAIGVEEDGTMFFGDASDDLLEALVAFCQAIAAGDSAAGTKAAASDLLSTAMALSTAAP